MTLADNLNNEGHHITLIDINAKRLNHIIEKIDIQGVVGNGVSHEVLAEAGIKGADLLIAVTEQDEINMLACLIAKKLSGCQTIARVRDQVYYNEMQLLKEELGLSMSINPDLATANEIFNLIQIPNAMTYESFARGRAALIQIRIPKDSPLHNMKLVDFSNQISRGTLVCVVERGDTHEVLIPNGNTVLHQDDRIYVITPPEQMNSLFRKIGYPRKKSRDVMIAGGSRTCYYLASKLLESHSNVKIIEKNPARCEILSDMLPNATIINADAMDRGLLIEEGLLSENAMVTLTDMDEENILLALHVNKISDVRTIAKVSTLNFTEVMDDLPINSIVNPKAITSSEILRYVRAMHNSSDSSNIEALYYLAGNRVEALEFSIKADSPVTNIPLYELPSKDNLLIACINRGGRIIIPSGRDHIQKGDSVVIVTATHKLTSINDILRED